MKLRPVIAIIVAGVVWSVAMPALVLLVAIAWPALRDAVALYQQNGGFDMFETPMLITFQFLWPVTNLLTGLVTVLISRRQLEVRIVAGVLTAFFAVQHWWVYWFDFPVWYNVIVVLLVAPFVLLGGRLPALAAPEPSGEARIS